MKNSKKLWILAIILVLGFIANSCGSNGDNGCPTCENGQHCETHCVDHNCIIHDCKNHDVIECDICTPKITVTKNVVVEFPIFENYGNTWDIEPTYNPEDGWGNYFSPSDIIYNVLVTSETDTDFTFTYNNTSGFIADINDGKGYQPFTIYVFTQTFHMNNSLIGSQVIGMAVTLGGFSTLQIDGVNISFPATIPSVNLTLSKQVKP